MDSDYSKTAFVQFLDFLAKQGLMKPGTVRALRVAVSRLLNELSEQEEADIRSIDVDIAARKLINRSATPLEQRTVDSYKRRFKRARREFLAWRSNPTEYKPRIGQRERLSQGERLKFGGELIPSEAMIPTPISAGLPLSFPLRSDFLVQIVIPRDLKATEAKRLGAFLNTLALDYEPT